MNRLLPLARGGLALTLACLCSHAWSQSAPAMPKAAPPPVLGGSAPASQAARPVRLPKPGLWESVTVTEDGNGHRTAVTSQVCLTQAELSTPGRFLPSQREPGMECEVPAPTKEGATLSWAIACKSADAVKTGAGKLSISSQSYLGHVELEVRKKGGKPLLLKQGVTGKWLGTC